MDSAAGFPRPVLSCHPSSVSTAQSPLKPSSSSLLQASSIPDSNVIPALSNSSPYPIGKPSLNSKDSDESQHSSDTGRSSSDSSIEGLHFGWRPSSETEGSASRHSKTERSSFDTSIGSEPISGGARTIVTSPSIYSPASSIQESPHLGKTPLSLPPQSSPHHRQPSLHLEDLWVEGHQISSATDANTNSNREELSTFDVELDHAATPTSAPSAEISPEKYARSLSSAVSSSQQSEYIHPQTPKSLLTFSSTSQHLQQQTSSNNIPRSPSYPFPVVSMLSSLSEQEQGVMDERVQGTSPVLPASSSSPVPQKQDKSPQLAKSPRSNMTTTKKKVFDLHNDPWGHDSLLGPASSSSTSAGDLQFLQQRNQQQQQSNSAQRRPSAVLPLTSQIHGLTSIAPDRKTSQAVAEPLGGLQGQTQLLPDLPSFSPAFGSAKNGRSILSAGNPLVIGQGQSSGQVGSVVSPLSPHVEPFSPSASSFALPGLMKLGATFSNSAASRAARSQSVTGSSPQSSTGSLPRQHQRVFAQEQGVGRSMDPSSDSALHLSGIDARFTPQAESLPSSSFHGLEYEHPAGSSNAEAMNARARAWSEASSNAYGMASGASSYAPVGPEYVESEGSILARSGSSYDVSSMAVRPLGIPRGLPQYIPGHPANYPVPGSAVARGLPVSHSVESFDRYSSHGIPSSSGPSSISDTSTAGAEEITTIFVVGFPEDFQEREFVNMFSFARGFEAATLKIPASTAAARERDAAAAAAVSAIAATLPSFNPPPAPAGIESGGSYGFSTPSSAGGSSYDHLNNPLYEEAYNAAASNAVAAGASGGAQVEGAQRVTHALAAAALTASASTASLASQTNRKQIIGFAKFRTRDDAMEARDMLSGRKVDIDKGCVLKAEMAKKNLHTKKSAVDSTSAPMSSTVDPYPLSSVPVARPDSAALAALAGVQSTRGSISEREQSLLTEMTGNSFQGPLELQDSRASTQERHLDLQRDRDRDVRSLPYTNAAYDAFYSVHSAHQGNMDTQFATQNAFFDSQMRSHSLPASAPESLQAHGAASVPERPGGSGTLPAQSNRGRSVTNSTGFGKSLLQQLEDNDDQEFPLPDPAPGFGASAYASAEGSSTRRQPPPALPTSENGFSPRSSGAQPFVDDDFRRLALSSSIGTFGSTSPPLSTSTLPHQQHLANTPTNANSGATASGTKRYTEQHGFTSPELASPTHSEFRMPRSQNRADDNMPISTLYVGGLPAVLPNLTGPLSAGHLEETLRNVFSRCPGFRRLSFRQKSQGPMCFVEFEDVQHATRALHEMYGNTLGGLVKGGIRLAYSKNPLGVRNSTTSSGPGSPNPLSPSYFASDSVFGSYGSGGSVTTPTLQTRLQQEASSTNFGAFSPTHAIQPHASYFASGQAAAASPTVRAHQQQSMPSFMSQHGRVASGSREESSPTSLLGSTGFSPLGMDR